MMNNSEDPQCCIEKERQRLYRMVEQYGAVRNPRVIRQSMVLDELINNYNRSHRTRCLNNPMLSKSRNVPVE